METILITLAIFSTLSLMVTALAMCSIANDVHAIRMEAETATSRMRV